MYSLLYLVCMDAGLLCTRVAPSRAWDTPEALGTRGSVLWILWSDKSVPCPSPIQGSRVGQQLTVQGAATQPAWKSGVALLRNWWICREGRRVVNIILGTSGTCLHSHSLLHPQPPSPASLGSQCFRSDEVGGSTSVPTQKATSRLSCVPVLSQPSAVSGSSWVNLVKTPSAPPSRLPPNPGHGALPVPWVLHGLGWVIPPPPSHRQSRAPETAQIWEAIGDSEGQK